MRRHAFAIVLLVLAVTSPAAAQEAGVEFNLDGRIVDAASPAAPMPFPEYVGPIPKDVGGSKLPFSSSRLVPVTADLVFPYSAVGKLYVTLADGAVFSCTGTVVAPRLVLTAGHCFYVFRNGRGEFATSGTFIPAFRDNMAPYGRWSLTGGLVSSTWFNGGGKVPNAADYALVEVDDLMIDGKPQRISERIGGWIAAGGGKSYPG
ncbi:MAG TPA: hypothetical protein VIC28_02140, partial [Thermoanaerobaculia bacterium]